MALPAWLAKVNKHVFNPLTIRSGERPVLLHSGRKTGRTYKTPLDAHQVEDGWMFIINYGPGSDWVRNILGSGEAVLELPGASIPLSEPRLLSADEGYEVLARGKKTPPRWVGVEHCLVMKEADDMRSQKLA